MSYLNKINNCYKNITNMCAKFCQMFPPSGKFYSGEFSIPHVNSSFNIGNIFLILANYSMMVTIPGFAKSKGCNYFSTQPN